VTWRTDRRAPRVRYIGLAARDAHSPPRWIVARSSHGPDGRLRHRMLVRPQPGQTARAIRTARWVNVLVVPIDDDRLEVEPPSVPVR
jgi:hypothetical protein